MAQCNHCGSVVEVLTGCEPPIPQCAFHHRELLSKPFDMAAEWRRLLAAGYHVEHRAIIGGERFMIYEDGLIVGDATHPDPAEALRLAIASMEEQNNG